MMAAKIRKNDRVVVIAGKDKGKTGEVIEVLPTEGRVKVRGVNLVKKHQRQTPMQQGGIVEIEAALDVSNVAHIDPKTNKPTRVGFRTLEDGRKVRFAKASGEVIDQ
ncbi:MULTISPECIES: 50S ribosomal protein L24 [Azospirillaceae]|uniref:50S ribosomal protein L24 n=1 Tax=Azospirillaceae TaxID=2829815 RepID=UPI001B3B6784|nr:MULTISPECIES: 50S ribosomal protein L24 [Azospirillaceae]MDG5495617.1 50S ribosomal protein L24 [Niveispirillum sp. BGYR6]